MSIKEIKKYYESPHELTPVVKSSFVLLLDRFTICFAHQFFAGTLKIQKAFEK